ncbi:hypothetical protein [Photobacterium leiognathi]|uniref:hypothetical protein n=1 Tax=Photobacterium leiognathi TaxID=553611 RepID=UPI002981E043|nr:hypothetical protein [Photobacterium leiognathi]
MNMDFVKAELNYYLEKVRESAQVNIITGTPAQNNVLNKIASLKETIDAIEKKEIVEPKTFTVLYYTTTTTFTIELEISNNERDGYLEDKMRSMIDEGCVEGVLSYETDLERCECCDGPWVHTITDVTMKWVVTDQQPHNQTIE